MKRKCCKKKVATKVAKKQSGGTRGVGVANQMGFSGKTEVLKTIGRIIRKVVLGRKN
jgi:hypothetical protein